MSDIKFNTYQFFIGTNQEGYQYPLIYLGIGEITYYYYYYYYYYYLGKQQGSKAPKKH